MQNRNILSVTVVWMLFSLADVDDVTSKASAKGCNKMVKCCIIGIVVVLNTICFNI